MGLLIFSNCPSCISSSLCQWVVFWENSTGIRSDVNLGNGRHYSNVSLNFADLYSIRFTISEMHGHRRRDIHDITYWENYEYESFIFVMLLYIKIIYIFSKFIVGFIHFRIFYTWFTNGPWAEIKQTCKQIDNNKNLTCSLIKLYLLPWLAIFFW